MGLAERVRADLRYDPHLAQERGHAIDRWLRNVRTGHFERSLSALTGIGAAITAAEIFFEHDKASFGNSMMWLPVAREARRQADGAEGDR